MENGTFTPDSGLIKLSWVIEMIFFLVEANVHFSISITPAPSFSCPFSSSIFPRITKKNHHPIRRQELPPDVSVLPFFPPVLASLVFLGFLSAVLCLLIRHDILDLMRATGRPLHDPPTARLAGRTHVRTDN